MKRIILGIVVILLMLGMAFSVVASNSAPEESIYLPLISKEEGVKIQDSTLQVVNPSSKLLDVVPLINNEVLLIIQNNENNIVAYKYNAYGASNFVDGWDSGIGTLVSTTVKGCVWVVTERDSGTFIVHKVTNVECE